VAEGLVGYTVHIVVDGVVQGRGTTVGTMTLTTGDSFGQSFVTSPAGA
jgi:hypothetical protein